MSEYSLINNVKEFENSHDIFYHDVYFFDEINDLYSKIEQREFFITRYQMFFSECLGDKYEILYSEFIQEFLHIEEFNMNFDKDGFSYFGFVNDLDLKIREGDFFISQFQMFFYEKLGMEYMILLSEFIQESNDIEDNMISLCIDDISDSQIDELERSYFDFSHIEESEESEVVDNDYISDEGYFSKTEQSSPMFCPSSHPPIINKNSILPLSKDEAWILCRIWARIAIPILWQNPFKYWQDNPNIDSLKQIIYYKLKDEQDILKIHFPVKDEFIPFFSYLKYVKE
ncbi:2538_t:CDS:2, partial [Scutellospora calospora]